MLIERIGPKTRMNFITFLKQGVGSHPQNTNIQALGKKSVD